MYCCLIDSLKKFKTGINEIPVSKNIYWACSWQNFPHSKVLWNAHLYLTKPPFKTDVSYDVSKLNFFLSSSHSIKAISVFLKFVCYIGESFSSVFFHSRSTSSSLSLPSEPSETTLPGGIHLFSHGYKF